MKVSFDVYIRYIDISVCLSQAYSFIPLQLCSGGELVLLLLYKLRTYFPLTPSQTSRGFYVSTVEAF